jgi:hypothetical protein
MKGRDGLMGCSCLSAQVRNVSGVAVIAAAFAAAGIRPRNGLARV